MKRGDCRGINTGEPDQNGADKAQEKTGDGHKRP